MAAPVNVPISDTLYAKFARPYNRDGYVLHLMRQAATGSATSTAMRRVRCSV
jgi:hypothetical protein